MADLTRSTLEMRASEAEAEVSNISSSLWCTRAAAIIDNRRVNVNNGRINEGVSGGGIDVTNFPLLNSPD